MVGPGRDMPENEGRQLRGCKIMEGLGKPDKTFVLDMGMYWKSLEGHMKRSDM